MAKYTIKDNFRGLYQTFTTYQRTQNTVKKTTEELILIKM